MIVQEKCAMDKLNSISNVNLYSKIGSLRKATNSHRSHPWVNDVARRIAAGSLWLFHGFALLAISVFAALLLGKYLLTPSRKEWMLVLYP
jgi:hypothetical protein